MVFCSIAICSIAQNPSEKRSETPHRFSIYHGKMAYNNSFSLPNGMAGNASSFRYQLQHQSTDSGRTFLFNARFDYCGLKNRYIIDKNEVLFQYLRFNTGAEWLWRVYGGKNNFGVSAGTGGNIDAEYITPTTTANNLLTYPNTFGKWLVSNHAIIKANYTFKKITIENIIHIPLAGFGHFPDYQYSPSRLNEHYYRYFVSPNTFTYLGNYRLVDNEFNVSYPCGKVSLSLSYIYSYCNYNINSNTQKYAQHLIGIGIQF